MVDIGLHDVSSVLRSLVHVSEEQAPLLPAGPVTDKLRTTPGSPNFTPSDFSLFLPLKKRLVAKGLQQTLT